MKFDSMQRKDVGRLQKELRPVIEKWAESVGLSSKVGRASYDPSGGNCSVKVEFALIDQDGNAQTQERVDFGQMASIYGLKPEHLDKTFKSFDGKEYKIVGLRRRARKRPILAERQPDGKCFVFGAEQVKMLLERE
jgi:hypothetical protein